MKITQVSKDFVQDNLTDYRLYRVVLCDDGNYGKSHIIARIKPVKNLTVEELTASMNSDKFGFILIEE